MLHATHAVVKLEACVNLFVPLCHLVCNWSVGLIFGVFLVMFYLRRREQVEFSAAAAAALQQMAGRQACFPQVDWFGFICKKRDISCEEQRDSLSANQTQTRPVATDQPLKRGKPAGSRREVSSSLGWKETRFSQRRCVCVWAPGNRLGVGHSRGQPGLDGGKRR